MTLVNQILSDGRTVKAAIVDAICTHMPSAAIASGLVSPVDVSGLVRQLADAHGWRAVEGWGRANGAAEMTALGLTWVRNYCGAHGLPTSDMVVKPLRAELLRRAMVEEANAAK